MRAILAVLFALAAHLALAQPVWAADDPADLSRRVIEQQFEALSNDDIDTVYALAAPGIQSRYPSKELFFAMVKGSYEPIYHPGNYAYGRSLTLAEGALVLHEVMIESRDGKYWKAFFRMTRQPDGAYKIEGVLLIPDRLNKGA